MLQLLWEPLQKSRKGEKGSFSKINKELIGSPNKTLIKGNLFDFIKKSENMNLCGSEKSVLKPFLKVVNF